MTNKTKLTIMIATLFVMGGLSMSTVKAEDNSNCQVVYGGQVCSATTPEIADTAGSTDILFTLSGVLYSTGLGSFILAKKADKLIPLK